MQFEAYLGKPSDTELQDIFLNHMYHLFVKEGKHINFEDMDWSDKVNRVLGNIKSIPISNEYKKNLLETAYKKIVLARNYEPDFILESELILIKGIPHPKAVGLDGDYNLSKYTKHPVKTIKISSDLASAPDDCKVASIINKTLGPKLFDELTKRNLCETYLL